MISDAMAMQVMADKYDRLAEQQTGLKERDKYRAYARIYYEMAARFERRNLSEAGAAPAKKQAGGTEL